jgi:hypothetical protein
MLYPQSNPLTIKKLATIKKLDCKDSAGQRCFLIFVQIIDDKEFGSPG